MAAVTSAGIAVVGVAAYVLPIILPVVAVAAICVTTVVLLLVLSSFSLFKMLYMFYRTYPCWPAVFCNWMDMRHLECASWINVFKIGYDLFGIASHLSNSFNGKIVTA
jgi:hypothetical protein